MTSTDGDYTRWLRSLRKPEPAATPAPVQSKRHHYLSTGCLHDLHDKCRKSCKYCQTPCICHCHPAVTP